MLNEWINEYVCFYTCVHVCGCKVCCLIDGHSLAFFTSNYWVSNTYTCTVLVMQWQGVFLWYPYRHIIWGLHWKNSVSGFSKNMNCTIHMYINVVVIESYHFCQRVYQGILIFKLDTCVKVCKEYIRCTKQKNIHKNILMF